MSGVRSGKGVTVINSMVRLTSGQTASEGTGQAGLPFPVMSIPTKGEARAKTLRGEPSCCICRAARRPVRLEQSEQGKVQNDISHKVEWGTKSFRFL